MKHNSGRSVALVVAAVAGLLVPAAAEAETGRACRQVALPTPAGTFSDVTGGDPSGHFLVGHVRYPDRSAGAVWRNGRFSEIDATSLPNVQIDYHDINRYGVVVGERMTDYSSFHTDAFTYRDGAFTLLPPLRDGDSTEALGINARGDVVGNSIGNGLTPVVWPAGEPGTVRELTMPDGQLRGRALGIDEDGSVVGYLAPYPPGTPYLWPANGTPRPLPVPEGSDGGLAVAIQRGIVAGNVFDPATNATVPALWNLRTGEFRLHRGLRTGSLSVNRLGTIGAGGAVIHANGRVASVGEGALVHVVTDDGIAVGTTDFLNGQAVRWLGC